MRLFAWLATAALMPAAISAAGEPAHKRAIDAVTFDDAPPAVEAAAPAALPAKSDGKPGWVLWIWDDESRSDPGQTFQLARDAMVTGVSILFASAENLGGEAFTLRFEGFGDIQADVKPAEPQLAVYRGRLPDDFDRQSPGKWVTFRLSRPIRLQGRQGYAFRLGFDQERDYDLRRAFIRAGGTDEAGRPLNKVDGRLTRRIGEQAYAGWGSVEDMFFVLRTDPLP